MLGSEKSQHATKSHVMAIHPHSKELRLAKVKSFCKLFYNVSHGLTKGDSHSMWVACVFFNEVHECRVWFGAQTEVWRTSTEGPYFISLSSIKCRVAYCTADVDFGRYFGNQTVIIASLLSDFGN